MVQYYYPWQKSRGWMSIETELSTQNRDQTEKSEDCTQSGGTIASLTFTHPHTEQWHYSSTVIYMLHWAWIMSPAHLTLMFLVWIMA